MASTTSASARQFAKRRDELALRANDAQIMLANNTLVPFEGNIQSETDAVIMAQQGQQRSLNEEALLDEINNETGHGLNMLAYYPVVDMIFDSLLPGGVHANHRYGPDNSVLSLLSPPSRGARVGGLLNRSSNFARNSNTPYDHNKSTSTPTSGALAPSETPDKLNKMYGNIKLDERVMAQLSIAAALVVGDILENVPSHEIQDSSSTAFQTKRVYYYEDLVKYIQSKYGNVITLDTKPGDAFEHMTSSEVNNFARSLLTLFLKKPNAFTAASTSGPAAPTSYGVHGDDASIEIGAKPTLMYEDDTYKKRVDSMLTVTAQNVGKVWKSKSKSAAAAGDMEIVATLNYIATRDVVRGYSNIAFGTKIKSSEKFEFDTSVSSTTYKFNILDDIVISILSLVSLHVMTYALSYAIDSYIRLAIRGAERDSSGAIQFCGIAAGSDANVITPQMIFPGIKAALEMYNVNPRVWDRKVAFHLHTNPSVMSLFLEAKRMYDIDDSRPGIKGFQNAKGEDPTWMKDRATQRQLEEYYAKAKGRMNYDSASGGDNDPAVAPASGTGYRIDRKGMGATLGLKQTENVVKSLKDLRRLSPEIDELRRIAGRDLISSSNNIPAAFGRRHRRKPRHSASFGKKVRKHRRSSSFGKKVRKHRRSASFGKKTRKHRRSASFGKKSRKPRRNSKH
jgi:hypothetical protein